MNSRRSPICLLGYRKEAIIFFLILAQPSTGFVVTDKSLNLSKCWFLHLQKEDRNSCQSHLLSRRINW